MHLFKMPKFAQNQIAFLNSNELCRIATATRDGVPQVTPVMYTLDNENLIIATDYGTRKLKNLKENPLVSIVVDEYEPNRGVLIQGKCEIHERGEEYLRMLKILFERFDFYRNNPWGEGESPILKINPTKVRSWGL